MGAVQLLNQIELTPLLWRCKIVALDLPIGHTLGTPRERCLTKNRQQPQKSRDYSVNLVDGTRLELVTSALRTLRSPS